MPDWLTNLIKKSVAPIVTDELAKRAIEPKTTEVPTNMLYGQMGVGGGRRKYGASLDFDSLRTFSVMYDVARACINHRKRQINNLEWSIVPKDPKANPDKFARQIQIVTDFFEEPSHGNDFKMWVDKLMEDLLVMDAGVLWKDRTYGGALKELLPVDASTIRMRIGEDGTLPEPPNPAFQQVIFGEVRGEYTTEEMYYKMFNPRNNSPYGLSPLESLVIGVDMALRSQLSNANLLSEGTIPEGFFGLPDTWTAEQIKDFQVWFDSMMSGNFNNSSRIKFMPGGKGVGYIPTKKPEDMRYFEMEKWLLLKTCALFDVQPEAIGFIENITSTTSEGQKESGNERGLVPTSNFLKKFFSDIIKNDFAMPELKFEWKGLQVVDDEFELDRNDRMLKNGALTVNEWRLAQGLEPLDIEAADIPLIYTAQGAITLESVGQEPDPVDPAIDPAPQDQQASEDNNALEEMMKWERKAINHLKEGKGMPVFKAEHIDRAAQTLIDARLTVAKSREEIKAAFRPFKNELTERVLIRDAVAATGRITAYKRTKYERAGQGSERS